MVDNSEKLKRLEKIRRKKAELQKQLNSSARPMETEKTVDQLAKEVLKEAKNPAMPTEDVQQNVILKDFIKKKINESLSTSNFTEFFGGKHPEKYDEITQCQEQKSSGEESEEDNAIYQQQTKKTYESFIIRKKAPISKDPSQEQTFDSRKKQYALIPDDQKRQFLDKKKEEIVDFISKENKVVERALNEKYLINLFRKFEEEQEGTSTTKNKKKLIKPICEFFDESCVKRAITSLEWSLKHPELLLTAFSKDEDFNLNQQNGLILLWSLALRKTPEFVFTCQPEVTSAIFHTYNPKLVIGGTFSGQLLFWDTRGKSSPVDKTPLGIGGGSPGVTHSSSINCLGVIGSTNANHIISVSIGSICMWSLSNLSKPVKRIEIRKKGTGDKVEMDDIGALSMGIQQFDTNSLLIGSDDNDIYQITMHGNENTSNIMQTFKGHEAPVYYIDNHPGDHYNTGNFTHLFLSSSADWTTRLWTKSQPDAPLLTIDENDDYVYCCKWCPTNASMFACGDGSGHLDFWDLNEDTENPKFKYQLGNDVINKLSWSEDGRRLAVGDSNGKARILGLSPLLYKSKVEDSLKFKNVISKLKMNQ